jgi:putative hemolysin
MSNIIVELVVIGALIGLNGVLALSEIATVSSRLERLRRQASGSSHAAKTALELAQNPERLLSTVQIGITLVGIFSGAYAGVTIAKQLEEVLVQYEALARHAELLGVAIVVSVITFLSLIFGELVPKRIALTAPERWAIRVAPLMSLLSRMTMPVVWLLSATTKVILRILRVAPNPETQVTDDEIDMLMEEGARLGVFTSQEQDLVTRALDLDDYRVHAVMTPRPCIVSLCEDMPFEELVQITTATPYSRLPVLSEDNEQILGILDVQRFLAQCVLGRGEAARTELDATIYTPETGSALDLINVFRQGATHLAIVVDEYGSYVGIVTLHDVLRGLIGEVAAADDPAGSPEIHRREDGSYLVGGMVSLHRLREVLELPSDPEMESQCSTVSGLVMALLQRIPGVGDEGDWAGYRLQVVDMDGRRVDKVLFTPLSPIQPEAPDLD